jgi:hypothetical protein
MKHAIYALLALCLVLSGSLSAKAQDNTGFLIKAPSGDIIKVAAQDLGTLMTWEEAKEACANLGDGWRLPEVNELYEMNNQLRKSGKGNFRTDQPYWSKVGYENTGEAWYYSFNSEKSGISKNWHYRRVRAVRDLK